MLSVIYEISCIMIPCIIYQSICLKSQHGKKIEISHFVWVYIFLLYIFCAFEVAGLGSVWDIGEYDTIIRLEEINIIPFQSEGFLTYILNIIMFMPLGFLLPLIWKKYRSFMKMFITGFGFSLAIEICQLFNRRNSDIDDLLMNTLGALVGYIIWLVFKKIFKSVGEKATRISKNEPIAYLILGLLGEFFLYNWKLLI